MPRKPGKGGRAGPGRAGTNRNMRSYDDVAPASHTLPRQLLLARSGAADVKFQGSHVSATCTLSNIVLLKWRGGIASYETSFGTSSPKPDSKGTINTCLPLMLHWISKGKRPGPNWFVQRDVDHVAMLTTVSASSPLPPHTKQEQFHQDT